MTTDARTPLLVLRCGDGAHRKADLRTAREALRPVAEAARAHGGRASDHEAHGVRTWTLPDGGSLVRIASAPSSDRRRRVAAILRDASGAATVRIVAEELPADGDDERVARATTHAALAATAMRAVDVLLARDADAEEALVAAVRAASLDAAVRATDGSDAVRSVRIRHATPWADAAFGIGADVALRDLAKPGTPAILTVDVRRGRSQPPTVHLSPLLLHHDVHHPVDPIALLRAHALLDAASDRGPDDRP